MSIPPTPAVLRLHKFAWAKKIVLLVDVNTQTREARAKMLRSMGVTVHCVASAVSARTRFDAGAYNLVLIDLGSDVAGASELAEEFKRRRPRQLVAFLIGRPLYISTKLSRANAQPRNAEAKVDDRVRTLSPPTVAGLDFGQKIRDAEAAQQEVA